MNNSNIVIYPKGFLGYGNAAVVNEPGSSLDEIITSIKLDRPIPRRRPSASNHDIRTLWRQYCNGDQYITSKQFRRKVLITSLSSFGTQDFRAWANLQARSPFFTEMHRRFLTDTLNFIVNGNRATTVQMWDRLIEPREINPLDRDVGVEVDSYFDDSQYRSEFSAGPGVKPAPSVESVIHQWVSRVNGFEDMLASLHIFFGDNQDM